MRSISVQKSELRLTASEAHDDFSLEINEFENYRTMF